MTYWTAAEIGEASPPPVATVGASPSGASPQTSLRASTSGTAVRSGHSRAPVTRLDIGIRAAYVSPSAQMSTGSDTSRVDPSSNSSLISTGKTTALCRRKNTTATVGSLAADPAAGTGAPKLAMLSLPVSSTPVV